MAASDVEVRTFFERWVPLGARLVGGVTGALFTIHTGEPLAGPLVAPFISDQLDRCGKMLIDNHLAPRREERVGAAYLIACQLIGDAIRSGETLRADDFFDQATGDRSAFEEITEATLNAAMMAHEERKIAILAGLLKVVVTNSRIDRSTANSLYSMASTLTFRSLVVLHVIHERNFIGAQDEAPIDINLDSLSSDLFILWQYDLLVVRDTPDARNAEAVLGSSDIVLEKTYLTPLGVIMFEAMQAANIDRTDAEYIRIHLLCCRRTNPPQAGLVIDANHF